MLWRRVLTVSENSVTIPPTILKTSSAPSLPLLSKEEEVSSAKTFACTQTFTEADGTQESVVDDSKIGSMIRTVCDGYNVGIFGVALGYIPQTTNTNIPTLHIYIFRPLFDIFVLICRESSVYGRRRDFLCRCLDYLQDALPEDYRMFFLYKTYALNLSIYF